MKISSIIESYRVLTGTYGTQNNDQTCGMFDISMGSTSLRVMAYNGEKDGWEHVSVSNKSRCPNWQEMNYIKDLFWEPEDCVVQFHPPHSEYVNNHPYCLHLWKQVGKQFDRPDSITVGIKSLNVAFKK